MRASEVMNALPRTVQGRLAEIGSQLEPAGTEDDGCQVCLEPIRGRKPSQESIRVWPNIIASMSESIRSTPPLAPRRSAGCVQPKSSLMVAVAASCHPFSAENLDPSETLSYESGVGDGG